MRFAVRRSLLLAVLAASFALPATAADLLDTVKARGTLRIAMEGTYPPFNYKDPKTGELTGSDVDVAKLIAQRMGLKPEFVTTEWAAILAGLGAGKYDLIISQMNVTPQRQAAFDFTEPYVYSSPQLIVRKDDQTPYAALADLKGKKLGVGQGSVFEQLARSVPGINIKSYPAAPENLQDLAAGRIDAALNDGLLVAYLLKNTNLPIKAGARMGKVESLAIPVKKGNPQFLAALNKVLADIRADGSLKAISMKWFGMDVSKK